MTDRPICARCGTPLEERVGRLCPRCLLALAATSGSDAPTMTEVDGPSSGSADGLLRAQLSPGETFGPYRIERLLGKGGMGEVYEAVHLAHARRVAVKILSLRMTEAQDRDRFLREGQLAASINHPNSVYVFGSEEIGGTPVISMELMPGGTLKDRVQADGPIAVGSAVEAMLQVIAGLEAAAEVGILHRDVKPSNCFVDADGSIKVGDFGLSISTLWRAPSLSEEGSVRGTPAFASPEQLKGRPLDVRSDIYAVGATLYYLLAAHAPFEGNHVIEVISRVVGERPPSLRDVRRDIPPQLARVVERCLAKDAEARYPDYVSLRASLAPFSAAGLQPAPLGLRLVACLIDTAAVAALVGLALLTDVFLSRVSGLHEFGFGGLRRTPLLAAGGWLAYYGLTEGRTGASPGKYLCGLRVTRQRASPTLWRIAVRVLIWWLFVDGWQRWIPLSEIPSVMAGRALSTIVALSTGARLALDAAGTILLFLTARRTNGFAGVHDLLSGTRVVVDGQTEQHSERATGHVVEEPHGISAERIGPYCVTGATHPHVHRAYDPRLRRFVWIVRTPHGLPAAGATRRAVARPARLRWLNTGRDAHGDWDAYEAPAGAWWRDSAPRPWAVVSRWIAALASEFKAASADGTLPPLTTTRTWVGADDRITLIDWEPDAVPRTMQPANGRGNLQGPSALLSSLASRSTEALAGVPVGMAAGAFVRRLEAARAADLGSLCAEATMVAGRPGVVTRRARARHLGIGLAVPLAFVAAAGFTMASASARARYDGNDVLGLLQALAVIDVLERQERDTEADEQLRLAHVHARAFLDGPAAKSPMRDHLPDQLTSAESHRLNRAAQAPTPSSEDVRRARDLLSMLSTYRGRPIDILRLATFAEVTAQPGRRTVDDLSFRVGCAALLTEFEPVLTDQGFWRSAPGVFVGSFRRRIAQCLESPPRLSAQERDVLARLRASALPGFLGRGRMTVRFLGFVRDLPSALVFGFSVITAVGLGSALLFRGGLVLRRLGLALVTANGAEASYARITVRSIVTWAPGVAICAIGCFTRTDTVVGTTTAIALLLFAAGIISAMRTPSRGWQDRVAGTYLVPE